MKTDSDDNEVESLSIIGLRLALRLAADAMGDESDLLLNKGDRNEDLIEATKAGSESGVGGMGLLMSKGVIFGLREPGTIGMGVEGERGHGGASFSCRGPWKAEIGKRSEGGSGPESVVEKLSIEPED